MKYWRNCYFLSIIEPTISSYELLVHEPIRLAEIASFHPLLLTVSLNLDRGVARSGVNGPLMVGSSSDKF